LIEEFFRIRIGDRLDGVENLEHMAAFWASEALAHRPLKTGFVVLKAGRAGWANYDHRIPQNAYSLV
jgi:hypothetical protein